MRVTLVDPALRKGLKEAYETMGIAYIASVLREGGHEVTLISSSLDWLSPRKLAGAVRESEPELLGISVLEVNAKEALGVAESLKSSGIKAHINLGGHFPSFNHRRILRDFPFVDSVTVGEGEYTLLELANRLERKEGLEGIRGLSFREDGTITSNPPRPLVDDLDSIPYPARDFTPKVIAEGGPISVLASRGCYANCSFCSIRSFYGLSEGRKWRTRSPERVIDEMESLVSAFGRRKFKFIDDQFIGRGRRGRELAYRFAGELLERKLDIEFIISCRSDEIDEDLFRLLKEAGLRKVFIGIESGTEKGLRTFNKGVSVEQNRRALEILDRLGIRYVLGFIMFDPYTTFEDVKGNFQFLSNIAPYWMGRKGVLAIEPSLIVHGGTPIHRRLKAEGRLLGSYLRYGYRIEDAKARVARAVADFVLKKAFIYIHDVRLRTGRFLRRMSVKGGIDGSSIGIESRAVGRNLQAVKT